MDDKIPDSNTSFYPSELLEGIKRVQDEYGGDNALVRECIMRLNKLDKANLNEINNTRSISVDEFHRRDGLIKADLKLVWQYHSDYLTMKHEGREVRLVPMEQFHKFPYKPGGAVYVNEYGDVYHIQHWRLPSAIILYSRPEEIRRSK